MKKRICIAQIAFRQNIASHINHIKEIISANRLADLIVFPELILHGHPSVERPEGLLYRRVVQYYRTMAADSSDLYSFIRAVDARVILGELKGKPGHFYNVATYIDRHQTSIYEKTHIHRTENFLPGKALRVFDTPLGKLGPLICFDGAFSEAWRVLALKGARIVVNISATPQSFPLSYIRRRLQGAALENQLFIIYVNRPGGYFSGHSGVIDPHGEIIVELDEAEDVFTCEIDLAGLDQWRAEEEIFPKRRPLLYRDILRTHSHCQLPQQENSSHRQRAADGSGLFISPQSAGAQVMPFHEAGREEF